MQLTNANIIAQTIGDALDNVLMGTPGVDTLLGMAGNDVLDGGAGADILDGGLGEDTASYADATAGVNVYLTLGGPSTGDAAGDVFTSIEDLVGSNFADQLYGDIGVNKIHGGAANDTLYGWGGDDWLYGDAGDDNIIGGTGHEHMDGGAGTDTLSYQLSTAGVTISLVDPSINTGDAAGDVYTNFEDVTGSNFDDVIVGDDQPVNNLWGLAGNDRIYGGGGYDVMIGDKGADYLDGGAGRDMADYETADAPVVASLADPSINQGDAKGDVYVSIEDIAGGKFNDILFGDSGDNNMEGLPGNDQLYGGAGNDGLEGGPGADRLDGGDGIDSANYSEAGLAKGFDPSFTQMGVGVVASMLDPSINKGEAAGDTYFNIENMVGSTFADTLQGDNNNNTLLGQAGNDALLGAGGDDLLEGGTGGDAMDGGAGYDYATYHTATSGVVANMLNPSANYGDAAGDTYANIEGMMGSAFGDVLGGDDQPNRLFGEAGNDGLFGNGGDDFLYGGAGADLLDGGAGFDTVSYDTATSGVTASLQNPAINTGDAAGDTYGSIEALQGSHFDDVLYGYDFATNLIYGGDGNDQLFGGAAGDTFIGGAGADAFHGGAGVDTVSYMLATAGVDANMLTTVGTAGEAAGDTFSGIENLIGSNFGDVLGGDDAANVILGGDGNDYLFGQGGNDSFEGGAGADYMSGGAGIDVVSYAHETQSVTAYLMTPSLNAGAAAGDSYDTIENLIGTAFADTLGGSDIQNSLFGGAGADTLLGFGGDDILEGGAGADHLVGGDGYDYASYSGATAGVTVFMQGVQLNSGDAAGDTYDSIEGLLGSQYSDILGGDGGSNTIQGNGGSDILYGGGGADLLVGGEGDDLLVGGPGFDILDGGSGWDAVYYVDSAAGVHADLKDPSTNTGDAQNDKYINVENMWGSTHDDVLGGDDGINQVFGMDGNDTLNGYAGNDLLYGGQGADQMTGGAGVDNFVFVMPSEGGDTITDFTPGTDIIGVSEYWFHLSIGPASPIDPARFVSGVHPVSAAATPSFLFDTSTHQLFYDADGSGAIAPTLLATFSNGITLTASDVWQG